MILIKLRIFDIWEVSFSVLQHCIGLCFWTLKVHTDDIVTYYYVFEVWMWIFYEYLHFSWEYYAVIFSSFGTIHRYCGFWNFFGQLEFLVYTDCEKDVFLFMELIKEAFELNFLTESFSCCGLWNWLFDISICIIKS